MEQYTTTFATHSLSCGPHHRFIVHATTTRQNNESQQRQPILSEVALSILQDLAGSQIGNIITYYLRDQCFSFVIICYLEVWIILQAPSLPTLNYTCGAKTGTMCRLGCRCQKKRCTSERLSDFAVRMDRSSSQALGTNEA